MSEIKIIAGTSHPELVREICKHLGVKETPVQHIRFKNDNLFCKIEESIREADVFVIQTSRAPVNDMLMELYIMIDAAKYASAGRITAVLPYFPYVRSDQKDQPRIPVTARLVADHLVVSGANRVLTLELHSTQIMGFFHIPADQLYGSAVIIDYLKKKEFKNAVIVAPDAGSVKRARYYAKQLDLPLAFMDKRRDAHDDRVITGNIIGEVKSKKAIIVDDEVSTGETLFHTAETLLKNGVKEVSACCVHGVLVDDFKKKLEASVLKELVVTNTIPVPLAKKSKKLVVLSVAKLLAEGIKRVHDGASVSELFS